MFLCMSLSLGSIYFSPETGLFKYIWAKTQHDMRKKCTDHLSHLDKLWRSNKKGKKRNERKTHAVTALIWPILVGRAINNMNEWREMFVQNFAEILQQVQEKVLHLITKNPEVIVTHLGIENKWPKRKFTTHSPAAAVLLRGKQKTWHLSSVRRATCLHSSLETWSYFSLAEELRLSLSFMIKLKINLHCLLYKRKS